MSYPLPLTRTEAYLAYKAGVIQQSDLKPSLAVPRIGIDAWLAYWTELTNDYPKNPDGTPMILQEEEAYIAYLCGVLDTYPEKCLRRVGAYLRYIISARWGRPDHPLNREELYLSLIKTQFIPSGDPSSDITIDGTTKAPFVDVKMYGDTFQHTYTGKNLLNCLQQSDVQQGIRCEVSNSNTLTVTGTSTTSYSNLTKRFNASITAGTFTFVLSQALSHRLTLRVYYEGGYNDNIIEAGDTYKTFTMSSDIIGMYIFMATGGAGNTFNETFTIQVVAGSTPDYDFEPYVGGIPAPNPEFPVVVQTVTGLQTVEVSGKNLFDIDNYSSAVLRGGGSAVSVAKENSTTLKLTNLISQGANFCAIPVPNSDNLLDKSVTISGTIELGTGVSDARVAVYAGTSASVGTAIASKTLSESGSFTLTANIPASYPSGANLIHFVIYGSGNNSPTVNSTVVYSNLQMEAGPTATTYAQYSKHTYEINLGKNLFDKDNARVYALNPAAAGSALSPLTNGCSTFIPITGGGKFTVSTTNRSLLDTYASVYFISDTPETATTWITRTQFGQNSSVTVNAPAEATYMGIYFLYSNNQTTIANAKATIQVERGSTATPYAEFFNPIELCNLGEYQDYIRKDGEDWKIHKATDRFIFTKAITSGLTKQSLGFVYNGTGNPLVGKHIPLVGKCSHFDVEPTTTTWTALNTTGMNSGGALWFRTTDTNFGDTRTYGEFAQWLVDAGVSFVYALETPTDITITNQALIDQLEALVNGGAEEGTTYIKVSATDSNLPGLLYVEAPKYE